MEDGDAGGWRMPRSFIGHLFRSMEDANVSYLSGRLQRLFGKNIPDEELRFRKYVGRPPRAVASNNVRVMLGGMAYDVLKAIRSYDDRKSGYEVVTRSRVSQRFQIPLDEGYCIDDIEHLFDEARNRYSAFIEAHAAARHFKEKDIPEGVFDDDNFGGVQLYRDLEKAVKIFDKPPL